MNVQTATKDLQRIHPDLQIQFSISVEIGFLRRGDKIDTWVCESNGRGPTKEAALGEAMTWFNKYAKRGTLRVLGHED